MKRLGTRRRRDPRFHRLLPLPFILMLILTAGCGSSFTTLNPVSSQGTTIYHQFVVVSILSGIVLLIVFGLLGWILLKYRGRTEDEEPEQTAGNKILEITWIGIPIALLVGLFVYSTITMKSVDADSANALQINVIGHQWWWQFDYPNDGITVQATPPDYENLEPPTLVLPVDAEVVLHLTSTDVVHSFYAPHTLYKMQAVPGNVNTMHLKFEKTGVFPGQCYQFCGLHHADMRFTIQVMSQKDYQAWLKQTQSAQGVDPAKLASASEE